jgi:hypothetical protein
MANPMMRLAPAFFSLMIAASASPPAPAHRRLLACETPALKPEDAATKFSVPEGFEVRIFASEPDVINPVAMSWDERGRFGSPNLYEYPLARERPARNRGTRSRFWRTPTPMAGVDKVTVFADGFNLLSGILVGNGGVYVGQAPDFCFLEDTDGDDKADKRTVIKTGFGLHDRHELLNGFTWGPVTAGFT